MLPKLNISLIESSEGRCFEPSKVKVKEWFSTWIDGYLSGVKPGTAANYKQHVENHIIPALGAIHSVKLSQLDIQKLYNKLLKDGLSPKTIKNLHGVLHRALADAISAGYIKTNPSDKCVLPRSRRTEMEPLDTPEIHRFLEVICGHNLEILFKVALFTGMRSGELLGLTWDCVDFDNGSIDICKQLVKIREKGTGYEFGPLKNDKPRILHPAVSVMQLLARQKALQDSYKFIAGPLWDNGEFPDPVFTHENGEHLTQSGVWKALQRLLLLAEIGPRRFHDLRHTYAVNAIRSGDNLKVVQYNLGHSTAAFTMSQYLHVTETMEKSSGTNMEVYITNELLPDKTGNERIKIPFQKAGKGIYKGKVSPDVPG